MLLLPSCSYCCYFFLLIHLFCKNITRKIIFTYEWPLVPFITFRAPHLASIPPYFLDPYIFTTSSQYTCACRYIVRKYKSKWMSQSGYFIVEFFGIFMLGIYFYIFIFCVIFYWNIFGFYFYFFLCCSSCLLPNLYMDMCGIVCTFSYFFHLRDTWKSINLHNNECFLVTTETGKLSISYLRVTWEKDLNILGQLKDFPYWIPAHSSSSQTKHINLMDIRYFIFIFMESYLFICIHFLLVLCYFYIFEGCCH